MLHLQFSPFPILQTTRLILRQTTLLDKEEIYRLRSIERVNRHLARPKARTVEDASAHIEKIARYIQNNELISWAITEMGSNILIGTIGFMNFISETNEGEVGYELLPEFHSKGIMTEALSAVLDYGHKTIGLKKTLAITTPENVESVKLLLKSGFTQNFEFVSENGVEIQYFLERN
jgi:[ribosomal protein S5]-alanine N-acetyltransferase